MSSSVFNEDSRWLLNGAFVGGRGVWVCSEGDWFGGLALHCTSLRDDRGVYYCPSRLKATATARLSVEVEEVKVLVIDDVGTKVPLSEVADIDMPVPSYIVETSPGNFQYGYFLKGGMEPAAFAAMRSRLRWKADGVDAVHWFRLPQGANVKDPTRKFMVRLVARSGLQHEPGALEPLLHAYGMKQVAIAVSELANANSYPELGNLDRLAEIVSLIPNNAATGRDEWVEVAHALVACTEKSEGGYMIFEAWSSKWPGGANPAEDRRLWDTIVLDQVRSQGGLLREKAEAADPDAFRAWDAAAAFGVVDDSEVPEEPAGKAAASGMTIAPVQREVAEAIVASHGAGMRFNHDSGCWHVFDGARWKPLQRSRKEGYRLAERWARSNAASLGKAAFKEVSKSGFYAGVEQILQQVLPCQQSDFDRDPMLLGTPGGTVDLRTGLLRQADRDDMISRLTRVTPAERGSPCPRWTRFLGETVPLDVIGNPDLACSTFLQQWAGYCLTGETREQVFLFMYGPGGNGKSVLIDTMAWLMGTYFAKPVSDLYFAKQHSRHMQEVAMLAGARMISISEVPAGARWDEGKLKDHTGGGQITANFMHQNSFSFEPQFKVVIFGNHQPSFPGGVSPAVRRRFKMLKLDRVPAVVDQKLTEVLKAEGPAILRWMIDGLSGPRGWNATGLMFPDAVADATDEFMAGQDHIAQWLLDRTVRAPGKLTPTGDLFNDWVEWRNSNGVDPTSFNQQTAFVLELETRGLKRWRTEKGRGFMGVAIKATETSPFSS